MKCAIAILVAGLLLVLGGGARLFAQEESPSPTPDANSAFREVFGDTPSATAMPTVAPVVTVTPGGTPAGTVMPGVAPVGTAQPTPQPTSHKRGWFGRVLHPFSGGGAREQEYKDPKLRGLVLNLEITPQTAKLSEVRQLSVHLTVTNKSKKAIRLEFPNDQRIDIHLMNSGEVVLTKWSDNHAVKEKPGTLLINPQEHVEYKETISTRDLTPDKVYIAEAFFPKYPDLRIRQKFLTAP